MFKEQFQEIEEASGEGMSEDLQRATITLINKIVKTTDALKKDAEKLDKRYMKETGLSFFFDYVYNDKPITKQDIEYIKAKKTI